MKLRLALLALPAVGFGSAFADEKPSTVQVTGAESARPLAGASLLAIIGNTDENDAPVIAVEQAVAAEEVDDDDDGGDTPKTPDLSGFGFGLAVNYSFEDEIQDAFLDTNGIVRTNERTRGDAAFILEGHFLGQVNSFWPFSVPCAQIGTDPGPGKLICGSGPFVALKTGGSTVLVESVGIGWMWGVKHNGDSTPLGGLKQFNFGIGISVDPSVKTLANGFEQNQPLPSGETEIRYEDDMTVGLMAIFSIGL